MLIKEDIFIPYLNLYRTLHIFIPDGFGKNQRFGVIYMFDGHNLFLDEDATYGKSWNLMTEIYKINLPLMVVGIECNHEGNERLKEFTPYSFYDLVYGEINQKGYKLFKWITKELKPYIDNKYPTLKSREYTSIGGSSMGGLMALYGGIKYNDIFSKALCLSPYAYYVSKDLLKDIKKSKFLNKSEFYISFGSNEVQYKNDLVNYIDILLKIQRALEIKKHALVYLHIFKGAKHEEAAWQKETKVWLKELDYKKLDYTGD